MDEFTDKIDKINQFVSHCNVNAMHVHVYIIPHWTSYWGNYTHISQRPNGTRRKHQQDS